MRQPATAADLVGRGAVRAITLASLIGWVKERATSIGTILTMDSMVEDSVVYPPVLKKFPAAITPWLANKPGVRPQITELHSAKRSLTASRGWESKLEVFALANSGHRLPPA